ncbi:hypothetical protein VaNZ11_008752, partial [Volvox africanus]
MKVLVTKTLSSLYLDPPRDAPDSEIPELLPSLGSSPCGTVATTTAVWAGADHGRSSMPHLPPPAARLSLCIDFPGYLQALQHPPQIALTLPPVSLRRNAPAMHLSALYPSATESSTDPRVTPPVQYSALPPGFSLGSLAGVTMENGIDNGRGKGGCSDGGKWHGGRYSVRASVDAAAAPTSKPLAAPWVFPPPSETAVSQSQVPVQMDWSFDSDLQRARVQARHAAMDALDEIRYEHMDDSHCSSKDGVAEGHNDRAWGCFTRAGARLCSIGNGRS